MEIKRVLDLFLASIAITLLAIPIVLIALAVKATSPGPVLYWSERSGKNNKPFYMPKFRSMWNNTPDLPTRLLSDPQSKITPVGRFLRRTSLDELPQLWSILKGHMSFVGPRPVLLCEQDLIELRTQRGVHKLTPGLTGWAQINGRDHITVEQKVELDAEYMQRRSVWFDNKIFWLTVVQVMRRHGVLH